MLPPRPATRVLVVEHQRDAGLGRFAAPLAAAGLHLDVRRPDLGEPLPADADDLAGLVVLGGEAAAWEDERWPWLPATRALLLDATAREVTVLGPCLGAQLLAKALGGAVERRAGPELGLRRVHLRPEAADDPLLRRLLPEPLAPQGHSDVVTRLPAGATWLADGGAYPHQAFRVAGTAWGLRVAPRGQPGGLRRLDACGRRPLRRRARP